MDSGNWTMTQISILVYRTADGLLTNGKYIGIGYCQKVIKIIDVHWNINICYSYFIYSVIMTFCLHWYNIVATRQVMWKGTVPNWTFTWMKIRKFVTVLD